MKKSAYSIYGMCSVRCPIRVEVKDNRVTWIEGNQHLLGVALCAMGSAGMALIDADQRPQHASCQPVSQSLQPMLENLLHLNEM